MPAGAKHRRVTAGLYLDLTVACSSDTSFTRDADERRPTCDE